MPAIYRINQSDARELSADDLSLPRAGAIRQGGEVNRIASYDYYSRAAAGRAGAWHATPAMRARRCRRRGKLRRGGAPHCTMTSLSLAATHAAPPACRHAAIAPFYVAAPRARSRPRQAVLAGDWAGGHRR